MLQLLGWVYVSKTHEKIQGPLFAKLLKLCGLTPGGSGILYGLGPTTMGVVNRISGDTASYRLFTIGFVEPAFCITGKPFLLQTGRPKGQGGVD